MAEYLRKDCDDVNEVASGNDDDNDDDDANIKDVELPEISTGEALIMFDRLVNRR